MSGEICKSEGASLAEGFQKSRNVMDARAAQNYTTQTPTKNIGHKTVTFDSNSPVT